MDCHLSHLIQSFETSEITSDKCSNEPRECNNVSGYQSNQRSTDSTLHEILKISDVCHHILSLINILSGDTMSVAQTLSCYSRSCTT